MEDIVSYSSCSGDLGEGGGVVVPELLQQLFGIDFVPYASPPPDVTASPTICSSEDDASSSDCSTPQQQQQPVSPPAIQQRGTKDGRRRHRQKFSRVVQGWKRRVVNTTPRGSDDLRLPYLEMDEEDTPKRKGGQQQQQQTSDALVHHQKRLLMVQEESIRMRKQASAIERRVSKLRDRAARMQRELDQSIQKIGNEEDLLEGTKERLAELEKVADDSAQFIDAMLLQNTTTSIGNTETQQRLRSLTVETEPPRTPTSDTPSRKRANTAPTQHTPSSTFMRSFDLNVENNPLSPSAPLNKDLSTKELYYIDHDITTILDRLFTLGHQVCMDESPRFQPTRETQRLLQNNNPNDDVLTWIGSVDHRGFGHDWPVVKAHGKIRASPRDVYEFLLDSSQVKRYNKMSQGREDVLILQDGVTTESSSFTGDARIHRMLVKPKLLPKTIEVLSLQHSKLLDDGCSYMTVSRSVWEDDSGVHTAAGMQKSPARIRSEMLLGVQLLRPDGPNACTMTTITHVLSPGVPEAMAKRFAPISATNLLRDLQAVFPHS